MEPRRLNYLVSRLNRFELTRCEKDFIESTKVYFRERCELTEEQEKILEGIYNEKLRWAKLGQRKAQKEGGLGYKQAVSHSHSGSISPCIL